MFNSKEDEEKFTKIFFPHFWERYSDVKHNNTCFVHYTTAQAAISILKNKEFWMRDSKCMNDVSEVNHGMNCLSNAYKGTQGGSGLKNALISLGIAKEVEEKFDNHQDDFTLNTYLTCFSEHNVKENDLGRLSMWRAYGSNSGVAVVIKNHAFFLESELQIVASPVEYLNEADFIDKLNIVVDNITSNKAFIEGFDKEYIINTVFTALKFSVLCTKHPAFLEEREWRLICSPTMDDVSAHSHKDVETINGIPQVVYKIPLKNKPEIGLVGVEIPELIERIIIGPTAYPMPIWDAFVELLGNAGVEKPWEKVIVSHIPLRN